MGAFNPMQFIAMMRNGKNPQQLMLSFLQAQAGDSPMMNNLLLLAKNNDTKSIEEIARNLYKGSGKDFDKEFMAFRQMLGL